MPHISDKFMSFSVCLTSLSMTISRTEDSTQQSVMVNMGKRILKKKEREGICICITDSLCCTPGTDATL